jgi:hypothetical protein
MRVYIRDQNNKTVEFEVEGTDTVKETKQRFAVKLGYESADFHLYFAGRVLSNDWHLEDCNIQKDCTLTMIARLMG